METVCINTRGPRPAMAAFRSFRQVPSRFPALRIIALALQSLFVWIIFICQFKYVRVASSPVFESIEVEEEGESVSVVSAGGSRSLRRARVLWARSSSCDAAQRRALAHKLRLTKSIDETVTSWQTHLFLNSRKQTLFAQSWMPADGNKTRGLLILLHGLNEHSGRYLHFAMQLNLQGYGVYAMDWIGHGGSDGLHGYVPSLDYVVADTKAFVHWVVDTNSGLPCFLFGHSTGGAVALKAACQPSMESLLKGIILTSPALRVRPTHPVFGVIAPVFSILLPTLQFKGANKRGIPVSRDPAQLVAKYSDPLVYTGPLRIRTGSEILRITIYLQRNMEKVTVPFLVMHGTGDRVTDPAASQDLYLCAASKHKKLKLYDGYLHDLLFEPEREKITQDIMNWMDEALSMTQSSPI
ncbi:hypothetical protein L7F22_032276 [Adiantum nelumboides]|nr:hypothetical protein [Adiantum nelumboides]